MNNNFRDPLVAVRVLVALGCVMVVPGSATSSDPERRATCGVATFEDLYGVTGNRFRGAIGFRTRQSFGPEPAITGYGLGIDDAVIT